jgi:hypothetical protein
MSNLSNLPIISTDILTAVPIPKFIKLKNLPISPKYRSRMSNSQFDESTDSLSELSVIEFPLLSTPPIIPTKPNISPRKSKEIKKLENILRNSNCLVNKIN